MIDPKVVFEPVLGRWLMEYQLPNEDWRPYRYFSSLNDAKEYAQEEVNRSPMGDSTKYRIVDTQSGEDIDTGFAKVIRSMILAPGEWKERWKTPTAKKSLKSLEAL